MRNYAAIFLKRLAVILEFFISLMLAVGIILLSLRMASSLVHIPDLNTYPNYEDLLSSCFNLIIGVELIRMMYHHTPNSVFEVLLFAIARQIIMDHSSQWSSLIGVCAIAVLFATRKYLFCNFDLSENYVFRATSKIRAIRRILKLDIPYEPEDTLLDILVHKFEDEDIEIGVGACAYFTNFGLRIAKMKDGKISRIEVIRAIH